MEINLDEKVQQFFFCIQSLRSNDTCQINECNKLLYELLNIPELIIPILKVIVQDDCDPFLVSSSLVLIRPVFSKFCSIFSEDISLQIFELLIQRLILSNDYETVFQSRQALLFFTYYNEKIVNIHNIFLQLINASIIDHKDYPAIIMLEIIFRLCEVDDFINDLFQIENILEFPKAVLQRNLLNNSDIEFCNYIFRKCLYVYSQIISYSDISTQDDFISPYMRFFVEPCLCAASFTKNWKILIQTLFETKLTTFSYLFNMFTAVLKNIAAFDADVVYSILLCFNPHLIKGCNIKILNIFIHHEMNLSFLNKIRNRQSVDFIVYLNVIKNAISNYERFIPDIYNYFRDYLLKASDEIIKIQYLCYLFRRCYPYSKGDAELIISIFTQFFKEDSPPNIVYSCLFGFYHISYLNNEASQFIVAFLPNVIGCTLSGQEDIAKYSTQILCSKPLMKFMEKDKWIFFYQNMNIYINNDPSLFFNLFTIFLNILAPIPDQIIDIIFNFFNQFLFQNISTFLPFFKCLLAVNDLMFEPFMNQFQEKLFGDIGEQTEFLIQNKFIQSSDFLSKVGFLCGLLYAYGDSFFQIAHSFFEILWNLFVYFPLDDIEKSEKVCSLMFECAKSLKYLTNVEMVNKIYQKAIEAMEKGPDNAHYYHLALDIIYYTFAQIPQDQYQRILINISYIVFDSDSKNKGDTKYKILEKLMKMFDKTRLVEFQNQTLKYFNNNVLNNPSENEFFSYLQNVIQFFPENQQIIMTLLNAYDKFSLILQGQITNCILSFSKNPNIIQVLYEPITLFAIKFIEKNAGDFNQLESGFLLLSYLINLDYDVLKCFILEKLPHFCGIFITFPKSVQLPFSFILLRLASVSLQGIDLSLIKVALENSPSLIELNPYNSELISLLYIFLNSGSSYIQFLEIDILRTLTRFITLPQFFKKSQKIKGNVLTQLIEMFTSLVARHHDEFQQIINEYIEFPSKIQKIQAALTLH